MEIRYARICSVKGIGINEGWLIADNWFSTQELADIEAKNQGFKDFDELYLNCSYDNEDEEVPNNYCYWTSFEDDLDGEIESQGEYYTKDGKRIFI